MPKKPRVKQGDDLMIVADAYALYSQNISLNTDAFRAAVRTRNAQAVRNILGLPRPSSISFFTAQDGRRCVNIVFSSGTTSGRLTICVPRQ